MSPEQLAKDLERMAARDALFDELVTAIDRAGLDLVIAGVPLANVEYLQKIWQRAKELQK